MKETKNEGHAAEVRRLSRVFCAKLIMKFEGKEVLYMLLTDITKILRVLLASFGAVASQDDLTQRRVGQIGEVIGAVEDVAEDEEEKDEEEKDGDETVAEKRVEEAHDIIHRVAAILAMEDEGEGNDGGKDDGGGGDEVSAEGVDDDAGTGAGNGEDEPLAEVPWDGTLEGETIELKDDEEE